ncbi:hypothetical protein GCM10018966_041710 [Streptomyces yanii]
MIESLDIKTQGPEQPVAGLSGGNQQKVVVARALARKPSVLVAVRPTAGVDVKSKDSLLGVVRRSPTPHLARPQCTQCSSRDELDELRRLRPGARPVPGEWLQRSRECGRAYSRELVAAMEV